MVLRLLISSLSSRMKRADIRLTEWGRFTEKNLDYADEYGDSILFRFGLYATTTSGGGVGHKILCADEPYPIQKIGIIVKRLPERERLVLTAHYCAPLKECGNPFTKNDLADILEISVMDFNRALSRGRRMVENRLDKDEK